MHMIDEAIRWSAGQIVAGKKASDLLPAIIQCWFRIFGPCQFLVSDHEGSLFSEEASIALERWHVVLKPKPVGSHAYVNERHNALLRGQFAMIKTQATVEGLEVDNAEILAEALYAKNAMLQVHGCSPYQALLGRVPELLKEFESPGISLTDDALGGQHTRHATRLRELSLQSMIEGTAKARLSRASHSQSKPAGELLDLQVGDSVDIHRVPASKDQVGWRGPAIVTSVSNLADGFVDARWGGRSLSVRIADLRKSLVYVTLMDGEDNIPLQLIRQHVLTLNASMETISFVYGPHGWLLSKAAKARPDLFKAAVHVGHANLYLRCVGMRLGSGVSSLVGLFGMSQSAHVVADQ